MPQRYPKVPTFVNVRVTDCPEVRLSESNEASSSPHPLAALPATRSNLCVPPVTVHVTVPPTLIVVTGVPLASSCHLKLEPFTVAVVGAVDGDTVAVGDGDAGVAVAVVVGVGLALF
jgi:hypothetical protein